MTSNDDLRSILEKRRATWLEQLEQHNKTIAQMARLCRDFESRIEEIDFALEQLGPAPQVATTSAPAAPKEPTPRERCADAIRALIATSGKTEFTYEAVELGIRLGDVKFNPRTIRAALGDLVGKSELIYRGDGIYRLPQPEPAPAEAPAAEDDIPLPGFLDRRGQRDVPQDAAE